MTKNIIILILSIVLSGVSMAYLSSCSSTSAEMQTVQVDGKTITASRDQPIYVQIDETIGSRTTTGTATGHSQSAAVRTEGDITGWTSTAPAISLRDIMSGDAGVTGSITAATKNPMAIFFIFSAVALLVAIPAFIYLSKQVGILLFIASGGLLATALLATYAPITFGLSILAILGTVIFFYLDKAKQDKIKSSLTTIVKKIEEMPKTEQGFLKKSIKEEDDGTIKKVVTEIKSN